VRRELVVPDAHRGGRRNGEQERGESGGDHLRIVPAPPPPGTTRLRELYSLPSSFSACFSTSLPGSMPNFSSICACCSWSIFSGSSCSAFCTCSFLPCFSSSLITRLLSICMRSGSPPRARRKRGQPPAETYAPEPDSASAACA